MAVLIEQLAVEAARGRMTRREFLGHAAALGITAAASSKLLTSAAFAQGPKRGGTLRVGVVGGAATDSLDPTTFQSQVPFLFGRCWGETLVVQDPVSGEPVGVLAESWSASDDVQSWTFRIRKNVLFHNGQKMTPEDVAATLRRHSDPGSKSGALGVLTDVTDIRVDGDAVIVTMARPNADLPLLLSDYHLIVQPGGGRETPDAGIGTGPYVVEVNEPGTRYTAKKFAEHWRDDVGFVDAIEFLVLNDTTARVSALQSGQVHIINRVEPKLVALLERVPTIAIERAPSKGHYVFLMHCNTAPFDNNDVRMALKLAVDRETILKQVLQGFGTVGNDFPINAGYALFPEGIEQRVYDPDKAAFHYKKSGHSGPVLLRTSEVAFAGAVDAASLYQQQAAKAGITLDIRREPGDGYWENVWNKQPFSASYWGGRPTQDSMYSTAYHSKADWNDTRFQNERFDKLLLEARGELDQAKRAAMYGEMAMLVRDEGGLILPMFNDYLDARTTDVMGWVPDPNHETSNGMAPIKVWLAS